MSCARVPEHSLLKSGLYNYWDVFQKVMGTGFDAGHI